MFEYKLVDAIVGAKAVLPHTSKDDVTPVITGVNVFESGFVATDRYTVGVWSFGEAAGFDAGVFGGESLLVHRDAFEWLSKIQVRKLRGASVQMDGVWKLRVSPVDDDSALFEVLGLEDRVERSQSFDLIKGSYPPVVRLVNDFRLGECTAVALSPEHLDKVLKFSHGAARNRPVRFEHSVSENVGKPGPVRALVPVDGVGLLTALIQPNLLLG